MQRAKSEKPHRARLRGDERNPNCALSAADGKNTGPTLEMPQGGAAEPGQERLRGGMEGPSFPRSGGNEAGPAQARLLEDEKLPGERGSTTGRAGFEHAGAWGGSENPSCIISTTDKKETEPGLEAPQSKAKGPKRLGPLGGMETPR